MTDRKPMKFALVAPDNTANMLVRHIEVWLAHMLSAFLEGYRVEVSLEEDQHWRRTNITTRIFFDDGIARRAVGTLSFNWYHRASADKVKRRLEKRLIAFVERVKPKLKPPADVRRLATLRELTVARRAKREVAMAEQNARTIEAELVALDKLLE